MQRSVKQLFTILEGLQRKTKTDTPLLTIANVCATLHMLYGEASGAGRGSWWRGATLIGGSVLFRSVHVLCPRVRRPASLAFLRPGFLGGQGESDREQEPLGYDR